jgi:hypothetical protein
MARKKAPPKRPAKRKGDETAPLAEGPEVSLPPAEGRPDWLPPPESIVSETEMTSPSGAKYKIVRSTEQDAYDKPAGKKPRSGKKKREG